MITSDFLNGYFQALNNIEESIKEFNKSNQEGYDNGVLNNDEYIERKTAYSTVETYIQHVKSNYRQLVKDLQNAQSSK